MCTSSNIIALFNQCAVDFHAGFRLTNYRDYQKKSGLAKQITPEAPTTTPSTGTFAFAQNYPNPFNPKTQIQYELPSDGHVTLKVYNTLGQIVRTLVDEVKPAGVHVVRWDGIDDGGREVASAIYFASIVVRSQDGSTPEFNSTRKLLLMR